MCFPYKTRSGLKNSGPRITPYNKWNLKTKMDSKFRNNGMDMKAENLMISLITKQMSSKYSCSQFLTSFFIFTYFSFLAPFSPQILIKFQSDTTATGFAPLQIGPDRGGRDRLCQRAEHCAECPEKGAAGVAGSRGRMLGWLTCGAAGKEQSLP